MEKSFVRIFVNQIFSSQKLSTINYLQVIKNMENNCSENM